MLQHALLALTVLLLLISVYTDVRYRKILNAVTLPFAVAGLLLNIAARGWWGVVFSVEGVAMGLAVFFLSAFLGRILGAGDCKLFAAVGALQGPDMLLRCILCSLVAGGVLAIIVALARGVLRPALTRVWQSVYLRAYHNTPMDIASSGEKMRLPYALAIAAGSFVALWKFHGQF
ncbi:MAG: A24 family peptidase [Armatimonadota bacterium]